MQAAMAGLDAAAESWDRSIPYTPGEMRAMKRLFVLTIVAILAAGGPGCQSRRCCPWRNGPVSTPVSPIYDGMGAPSPVYSQPAAAVTTPGAPSGGCGPGCSSCGGSSPQVLSGPQAYAPGPSTGPVIGQ